MGVTKVDEFNAPQTRVYIAAGLPMSPSVYYNSAGGVDSLEWKGGEIAYNTTDNRFYIQDLTSGTTAHWRQFSDATVAV